MKPAKKYLIFLLVYFFSWGCGHSLSQQTGDEKKVSNCILPGYDSVVYYYGSSDTMKELITGNINDPVFISHMIQSMKEHSIDKDFKIAFKPTGAGDTKKNVADIVDLFNKNNIQNRYMESLDENEKKFFNTENMPAVIAGLNREPKPLKLSLYGNDNDSIQHIAKSESTIMLLLYMDSIYAYAGENITNGKQYSYPGIDKYIRQELKKFPGDDFKIVIEPTDEAANKNTVDILDKMQTNNIGKYELTGLSKKKKHLLNIKII